MRVGKGAELAMRNGCIMLAMIVFLLTKQTAVWLLKKLAARDDDGVTVTGDDE